MNEKELVNLYKTFFIIGDATVLKILFELDRYGEKTFSQLRDDLNINPATLSKKLKLLVRSGLIAPDKSHDHLRVFYTLHEHQRPLKRVLDSIERLSTEL
jgi:DNA-binding HxlR family transcriptional regulator